MKISILTICLITLIGSTGCSLFKDNLILPFCVPERPELYSLSTEEKTDIWFANPDAVTKLAVNETRLKNHVETIEEIAEEHNKQFKVECVEDPDT